VTTAEPARCSFCGKSQDDVYTLIAGPDVHICDECVDLSNDILMQHGPARWLFAVAWRSWRISFRATLRALTFWMHQPVPPKPPDTESIS
jgi:hypothetical protein